MQRVFAVQRIQQELATERQQQYIYLVLFTIHFVNNFVLYVVYTYSIYICSIYKHIYVQFYIKYVSCGPLYFWTYICNFKFFPTLNIFQVI